MSLPICSPLERDNPNWHGILTSLGGGFRKGEISAEEYEAALRQAVCSHTISSLAVINLVLQQYPEATIVRSGEDGYTPLLSVVHCQDLSTIENDGRVASALLKANPACVLLKSSRYNLDPLSIHIQSVSRLQPSKEVSASVLKILLEHSSLDRAEAVLETLFSCNSSSVMEHYAQQELNFHTNVQVFGRQTRAYKLKFWVWEWVETVLKEIHMKKCGSHSKYPPKKTQRTNTGSLVRPRRNLSAKPPPKFHALHVASQVVDCPLPFLIFAMRLYPNEIRMAIGDDMNLPLHFAASWSVPKSSCRKSMSLTTLLADFPKAMTVKNKQRKNPIRLEAESGSVIK